MKKRIITLVMAVIVIMSITACGDEKKTSSTRRSNHGNTLTEETLTEETLVEEIHVEEIHVEEIHVEEISWDSDNVTRWN